MTSSQRHVSVELVLRQREHDLDSELSERGRCASTGSTNGGHYSGDMQHESNL